jgi:hypothetical protein
MILQSLVDLYERLREREPNDIAEYGFEKRKISSWSWPHQAKCAMSEA